MFQLNGNRQRISDLLFAMIDSIFIMAAALGAIFIRFPSNADSFFASKYLIIRIILVVLLTQLGFYFFDLYDPRLFEERKRTFLLLLGSLGASSALILVLYYVIPSLVIGRGIFGISVILIFIFSLVWRLLHARIFGITAFKERVLIIGTGVLAKKIQDEITNNGYNGFEIVGFIDESGKRIGERIGERV